MLDIHVIREDPDRVRQRLAVRGKPELGSRIDELLGYDEAWRAAVTEVDRLRAQRNEVSPRIGTLKREGRHEEAEPLIVAMRELDARMSELEARRSELETSRERCLLELPNLPEPEVPPGGEADAVFVREWGTAPELPARPRPHWEIGESLGLLDLPRGSKIAGSGFPVYVGSGARLVRSLIAFMLDLHTREHGYTEVSPPFLVSERAAFGTGHLPKFGEDMYRVPEDGLYLIPTAEVPVTNLLAGEVLAADALPQRYVAYTPCFRREAGSHGKDTRGILRVHQFDKVELVRFERPEHGRAALEELTAHAEAVLKRLGLRYRVVLLAGGDLGFASAITYDLEVWAPGVERWLEVSSSSLYTDYQARRAGIRFRPEPGAKPEFVNTLNASGLALPRTLVALLENGQSEDGSVRLPAPLAEYFGTDRLGP